MAITSVGYDGFVDEVQFERIIGYSAHSKYGVSGSSSFGASTVPGQVLQVRVKGNDGTFQAAAWTAGVVDLMDADAVVQLEPVSSGSRWDLIVLRRDYQPPGGQSSIAVVKGTSAKTIPARNTNSGVLDDQPLWLVRVDAGSTTPSEYVDLRVFARTAGCTANDDMVRSYMNGLGTQIEINGKVWQRRVGSGGLEEWKLLLDSNDSGWVFGARSGTGWTTGGGDYVYSRLKNGMVEVRIKVTRNGPDVPVSATGDIVNMKIGQISADHAPRFTAAGLASSAAGRNASTYLEIGTGNVFLAAVSPGGAIRRGDVVSASGMYFLD